MKSFALIFAVYFFVLSILPCGDTKEVQYEQYVTEMTQQPVEEHNHIDFCSPFCVCSCCGVNFSTQFLAIQQIEIHVNQLKIPLVETKLIPFFSSYYASIWQPPKI